MRACCPGRSESPADAQPAAGRQNRLGPPLAYLHPYLDFVVILTTEPEFPECPFLPLVLPKIQAAAEFARRHQPELEIVADGGIETENVREVVEAGATVIVSGRGIFRPGDITENVQQLRRAAGES
ncbi:MAG TPA: hypothetical protein VF177_12675 [Anaerolineae bacterium]